MVNVAALLPVPGLEESLSRVEDALRRSASTEDPFLDDISGHLIRAGGKRVRPALTVASAHACGTEATDDVVMGGVAVELVQVGSLYHDDVMDEAATRRGVESVNHRWGNLVAILAGDFLLARASAIAADLSTEVAGLLARTIGRLCEGQVGEIQTVFSAERTEDAYLSAISGKTAALFASACRIGGLTSRAQPSQVEALTAFGDRFGMVFQLIDDVLDIVGTDDELGKPAGLDLVEGVYTLPVIKALADPVAGPELRAVLGRPLSDEERDKARAIVRGTDGVATALTLARRYAEAADATLAPFDGSASVLLGAGNRLLDSVPTS